MSEFDCFDTPEALALNKARMDHFLSLGIPLREKRVLEVGCGVGRLSEDLYRAKPYGLYSVDARRENLDELARRVSPITLTVPWHRSVGDIQKEVWAVWDRKFDVIFAYGVLYHLTNPIQALQNMKAMLNSHGVLALESIVLDFTGYDPREAGSTLPIAVLQSEASYAANQGIVNVALWPSKVFITLALKSVGFTHIYQPVTAPNHPEFRPGEADIHREIFVASFEPLENSKLDEVVC